MKKTLIISIIGLLAIIIFSIFIQNYLKKSSDELVKKIEELSNLVEADKVNEAILLRDKIKEIWEETEDKWAVLIDHNELDNIEETMHRVEILIGEDDEKAELLSELNKLGFYMEHIPEKEKFSLENIL